VQVCHFKEGAMRQKKINWGDSPLGIEAFPGVDPLSEAKKSYREFLRIYTHPSLEHNRKFRFARFVLYCCVIVMICLGFLIYQLPDPFELQYVFSLVTVAFIFNLIKFIHYGSIRRNELKKCRNDFTRLYPNAAHLLTSARAW